MAKKLHLYSNRYTGDIKYLSRSEAKKLNEDWSKVEQIVNDKGERGMRLQMEGATVDILENNTQAPKVVVDGNLNTK